MLCIAWIFFGVVAAAAVVWLWINFGGAAGNSLRYRLPQPGEAQDQPGVDRDEHEQPAVAIFAPGRDEAEHLPTVLPELCEQDYPNLRVVFIDDASTDATRAITSEMTTRYENLTAVRNQEEPPAGWMGKCWAINRGYESLQSVEAQTNTKADWLCFTDADIHWHPQLLRTAMNHALEHRADLLGVTPTLRFGSVGEAVVQLQLVLALGIMFPFEKAMDPDTDFALTGGAFILVRRSFYDQIGGHEAVKSEMVEDLKIGAALKAAGAKHRVAIAGDLQWCRMYDGYADMWEGLTKNAYAGLNHRWWLAGLLLAATLLLNVFPAAYVLLSVAWWITSPGWMPMTTAVLSVVTVLMQARALNSARKLMGMPWPYAWTMSPGSAAYAVILLFSVVHHHTTGNAWKGRRYRSA